MATMQQIIDRARVPLNDDDKVRYTDVELLAMANSCINLLKAKRPDLFYGLYLTLPADKVLGDTFPLDDMMLPAVEAYITGMAESRNDESVADNRAALFLQIFGSQV